jgi:glycosyltransferase involved in cell wall biosynthesis
MRILYFHQFFATRRRAHPTRSYEFARRFVAQGHEVTLVTRDVRHLEAGRAPIRRRGLGRLVARENVEGIDVVYLRMPYSNYMGRAARLLSFAGFTVLACAAGPFLARPDVVLAEAQPLTIGLPGLLSARLRGAPFVFEICDLWPYVPVAIGALRDPLLVAAATGLEEFLYREAEAVVVASEAARENLLARGLPPEKVTLVPNASDCDLFSPDIVDRAFRPAHGLEGKFVALYTGAMGPANGLDQLVEAAAELQAAGEDAVAIVGVGDGRERPRLERRTRELGLTNLLFLPPLPKDTLAGVVGAADVTLTVFAPHPAFETNSPDKFFDSLAAGKPVVCTLGGWWRRICEHEQVGVFTPPGDGLGLAAALAALAREPDLVTRMGRNARVLAEREFDRDLLAARLLAVLDGAVRSWRERWKAWARERGYVRAEAPA